MAYSKLWRFLAPTLLFLAACSTAGDNHAAHVAAPSPIVAELPRIAGPIAATAASTPWLNQTALMAQHGYVEEEYFLSGHANVYEWVGDTRQIHAVAGPGAYTNRILVRRPRDPARFSGNVEVTILNATRGFDAGGPIDFDRMVAQGDVWIGVTAKALTATALERFDAPRYAPLDWSNPAPPERRCQRPTMISDFMSGGAQMQALAPATSFAETEDGLIWDMLGQLGLLLKSDQRDRILPGFSSPRLYMVGVSQSAIYIRTWYTGFHHHYSAANGGRPIYDGYLGIVGPDLVRINQCAPDVPLTDTRHQFSPAPSVPFISLSSEGEMWLARHTHQPDAATRQGGIITYEVTGGSHAAGETPGVQRAPLGSPSQADLARAGYASPGGMTALFSVPRPAGTVANDYAWAPITRGAYHNLQRWVRDGVIPPQAPGIEVDGAGAVRRDADGNALGGVRMPYTNVPTAGHVGFTSAGGIGALSGVKTPFSAERLRALYPTHDAYVSRFAAATQAMVRDRWISQEDAQAMIAAAQAASVP